MKKTKTISLAFVVYSFICAAAQAQTPCTVPDFCTPEAAFVSTQTNPEDARLGTAVAIRGDLAIVGATHDSHCSMWNHCGAAYVYRQVGATWVEEAKLTASDASPGDLFGISAAIEGDWALVGNRGVPCGTNARCGAVYAFHRTGTDWTQIEKLVPSDSQPDDYFGQAISLSGGWAAIGKREAVYLFELVGSTWIQRQKLIPTLQGYNLHQFGDSVAMNSGRLIVGASFSGAVYFYKLVSGVWVADGLFRGLTNDAVGQSVSLDENYALAVSSNYGSCSGPTCGVAYRYRRIGNSWTFDGIMSIADPQPYEFSNSSPATISGDWAILGQYSHVFHRNSDSTWSEVGRLGAADSFVGWSSSPSINGTNVLIGGWLENMSSAYIFNLAKTSSDCNCDGQSDSCDAAMEGVGDCQGNSVLDTCDIYTGLSADCGGDLVPDECQSDCQSNGIEDSCDIAAGSADCNFNTTPDECELAYFDCNGNGRPDNCDTSNANGIPNDCSCITTQQPQPDPAGLNKSRFISFVPDNPGHWKAIRIKFTSLHHVDPPYTGGPSIPFSAIQGQVRWLGQPVTYLESSSNSVQFFASTLQCSPHFRDWSTIELLHVTGSGIVPSSSYEVQFVGANCNLNSPASYSTPLTVETSRWSDVALPFAEAGVAGQPDFGDVSAMVNKFRSAPGAPAKVHAKLSSGQLTGELNLASDVGFESISAAVDAFRGAAYPYTIASCP